MKNSEVAPPKKKYKLKKGGRLAKIEVHDNVALLVMYECK